MLSEKQKQALKNGEEFRDIEMLEDGKPVLKSNKDYLAVLSKDPQQDDYLLHGCSLDNYCVGYANGTSNLETHFVVDDYNADKCYALSIVDFSEEWLKKLHDYNSLDEYYILLNSENGVEATDILTFDVFDNDFTGGKNPDDLVTYSLSVIRAGGKYYLQQVRVFDALLEGELSSEAQYQEISPVSLEDLIELAKIQSFTSDDEETHTK